VLDRDAQDRRFIEEHAEGFEDFRREVDSAPWDDIEAASGVSRDTIATFADLYTSARHVVIGWTMGITHHVHGVENVQMIANLALLRGMVGRPNAGLMPIRGHSNVQGVGSVGVTPQLKQTILARFEQRLGVQAPKSPGLDTMACIEASSRGEMQTALCLGGNLFGSNPDARFAANAISRLDQITYLATTLNTGHAWGTAKETLVLPVLPRDEEPQPTTQESMFNFVRLSDGGRARYAGPRSEVSVLTEIGRRVLGDDGPVQWSDLESHERIRGLIAELIPGLEPLGDIDRTRREFHIPGRRLDVPRFPTPSGKARFHAIGIPAAARAEGTHLRLMTIRSEGQFNTVVYEEEDIYRGQDRRDVILMNPEDIRRLGQPRRRTAPPAGEAVRHSPGKCRDVLSGSERARAARHRSAVEDASLQVSARTGASLTGSVAHRGEKNGKSRRISSAFGLRPYSEISNASAVCTLSPRSAP
jgi:molybdopterin-dependent oxidoreductase alpha subunit